MMWIEDSIDIIGKDIENGILFDEINNVLLSRLRIKNPKLRRNRELKNGGYGKRAFLLATGPSIRKQNLAALEGEDCFSVSNFFLHEDVGKINPKMHFFAPYHEPLEIENFIQNWEKADKILPKQTSIVLGLSSKNMVKENNLFQNRKVYYLDFRSIQYVQTDIEKSIMAPKTGPMMVFPVLKYMGYSTIYLIGCDMNMISYFGKKVENFYEKDPRKNATDASRWDSGIITEMESNLIMLKQYKMYADNFKKNGIEIKNLSPISWIDFIEKVPFESVV